MRELYSLFNACNSARRAAASSAAGAMAGNVTSANSAATGLKILMENLLRETNKHAGARTPACG